MKEQKLLISAPLLYGIALLGAVFTIITVTLDAAVLGLNIPANFFLFVGSFCTLMAILVSAADVFRNQVKNRALWLVTFVIFGGIGVLYYLYNRKRFLAKSNINLNHLP
ncbi:hypothetical protein [Chryseobacterium sp.]|uniref:hypothetical protein n=1 Tax=Chryseobacterium sp. TaxID=1871047 RepID=UPI0011C8957B|nr:hypothetical protein [Chryseobacterium sp.]TXF77273.1 hypothetical protein FUA25_04865 [Chryseobacterium sp.]